MESKTHFWVEDIEPSFLTRLDSNAMRNNNLQVHEVCLAPEPPLFLLSCTIPRAPAREWEAGTSTAPKRRRTDIHFTGPPYPSTKHVERIRTRWDPRTEKEFFASASSAFPFSTTGEPNEAVGEEEELPYALESVADLEEGATADEGAAGLDECEWEIWGCALDGDKAEGDCLCLEGAVEGRVDWACVSLSSQEAEEWLGTHSW